MNQLFIYSIPAIVLIGIITSYEDIIAGKIRNKIITASLIYVVLLHIYIIGFLKFPSDNTFLLLLAIKIFASALLSILFWVLRIWSAADGKLFFAMNLIIPDVSYFGLKSVFISLAITFGLCIVYLSFSLMALHYKKFISALNATVMDYKTLARNTLLIFVLSWISRSIGTSTGIPTIALFSLTLGVYYVIGKTTINQQKYILMCAILIAVLRLFYDKYIFTLNFLAGFALTILIWQILITVINQTASLSFSREKDVCDICTGDVISHNIYRSKSGRFCIKKTKDLVIGMLPEGLTNKQLEKIQKAYKQDMLSFSKIGVKDTIPFAPFISAGTLITSMLFLFGVI